MPLFFFFIQIAVLTEIALPLRGSGMARRVPHHASLGPDEGPATESDATPLADVIYQSVSRPASLGHRRLRDALF